jgi:hypothetical protein
MYFVFAFPRYPRLPRMYFVLTFPRYPRVPRMYFALAFPRYPRVPRMYFVLALPHPPHLPRTLSSPRFPRTTPQSAVRSRRSGACRPAAPAAGWPPPPRSRGSLPGRTGGRMSAPRAQRAGACSRESRSPCRPSSADCARCFSVEWRSRDRCHQSGRRQAFPSARETAARKPTATPRSAAGLPRRPCRRRATTCPSRSLL